ncbi:MAG: NAD-glutamate dehydrogenase [Proteobacteria bacterium]|nr:MAG: NAD-glutamate dehydrogenase [Pseudomonadota bacterium]PIE40359.1 MAG: NAD-glutamate dehydrogenase [Gammaproteobacteria bacterium]
MKLVNSVDRKEFFSALVSAFNEKLPATVAAEVSHFTSVYLENLPIEEAAGRRFDDIYGAILSCWSFLQQFEHAHPKIRVFNPDLEENGWQSTHSIVAVIHPNIPFLVDSIRMVINSQELTVHSIHHAVINCDRTRSGKLKRVLSRGDSDCSPENAEAVIYVEVDRRNNAEALESLSEAITTVLGEVRVAVGDYPQMRNHAMELVEGINKAPKSLGKENIQEALDFVAWVVDDHFTFLGYDEYDFKTVGDDIEITRVNKSELGILRSHNELRAQVMLSELPRKTQEHLLKKEIFTFAKSAQRSRVHRPAYPDYISVAKFNSEGEVVGLKRFLGLYTADVYNQRHSSIPIVRQKTRAVLQRSGYGEQDYGLKEINQILAVFPRDDLFQIDVDDLFEVAMGIMYIQERRKIRLFIREDAYSQFYSALVFVPREIYSTDLRLKTEAILTEALEAVDVEFTTYFSESVLARTQFNLRVQPSDNRQVDVAELQKRIIEVALSWKDGLQEALYEAHGEEAANELIHLYQNAFPASYKEVFSPRRAVIDLDHIHSLDDGRKLAMSFYRALEEDESVLHFKLFHSARQLPLSDVLPVFENLGLKVIGEHPYEIKGRNGNVTWIHDFTLTSYSQKNVDIHKIRTIFEDLFQRVLLGDAENDNFNLLVLGAYLDWRQIAMFRAYARYMRQIRISNSQEFIAQTLSTHIDITRLLWDFFENRFNPEKNLSPAKSEAVRQKIEIEFNAALEEVSNISEDRVLRRYMELMQATLRTNFYQLDADGNPKSYVSYKISPRTIPEMPLPLPMFEIFVYSPRIEGVHLRGGKVARGGLRWSDRYEDYRTEVLGLVKAQQVKNAVIVPVGAKGGFVAKQLPEDDREAFVKEGIESYKVFINGLLDITDNLVEKEVVPPAQVVRHDEDDYYLVVAADKGTATFSDIANGIALERGFWLGDAFASGGSNGYDHKKMGITARGAWVSVERHFREMGINTAQEPFSVIGIGDMSGDVFGNGMLLSPHTKLVAAFNHMHIFIDPDPDPAKGYLERKRLFELPRSTWADYDSSLISEGGGVFSRSVKSVTLTPEIKKRFGIKADRVPPNMLISYILKSEVDLLWIGGIGTYVKASYETDADVGDKANDGVRINANELRCKVIGEGGNLGVTQRARIEFALNGGRCNTDFIDNAGGVDCSDHEVNIKILLNAIVANGDMTQKQRNQILFDMTDEVADLVLKNNYRQTQAISIASLEVSPRIEEYRRLIDSLESSGKLNRELEFIPDDETVIERKSKGGGLTRPELSVLISYVKGDMKEELSASKLPDEESLAKEIDAAFPEQLVRNYAKPLLSHKLRREIIATQIANDMVNHMGITFVDRLRQSTGASVSAVALAYIIAREVFQLESYWCKIEALDYHISSETQMEMMSELMRLTRRASRWLLRNRRSELNVVSNMGNFAAGIKEISENLPGFLIGEQKTEWQERYDRYLSEGIPDDLASVVAGANYLYSALGIIEAHELTQTGITEVAHTYYSLGDALDLGWFSVQLNLLKPSSHWQALARETFREDLDWQQRALTVGVLRMKNAPDNIAERLKVWMDHHEELIGRWQQMCTEIKATKSPEFAVYSVALRELLDLAQSTTYAAPGGEAS